MDSIMKGIASTSLGGWKFHAKAKVLIREIDHDIFFHIARVNYIKRHGCIEAFVGFQSYCDPRLDGVFVDSWNVFREFEPREHVRSNLDSYVESISNSIDDSLKELRTSQDFNDVLSKPLIEEKYSRLVYRSLISLNDGDYDRAQYLLGKARAMLKKDPLKGYPVRGVWLELLNVLFDLAPQNATKSLKSSLNDVREAIFRDRTSGQVKFNNWSL